MTVEGSTCIVTGGARGIGRALADAFLGAGAAGVTVADLDADAVAATAAELAERHGDRVLGLGADVADEAAVRDLVARTEERFGALDLFAANAGVGTGQGLEADDTAWERTWQVNVMAHVVAARVVVPPMLARGGGTFLTTASAAGLLTQIGDAPYSATKHAAVGFAKWLAITHGDEGLRVHCLCPQGVDTDMLRSGLGLSDGVAATALQGVIAPEDVATAVLAALDDGTFLVLPHPEVATHQQRWAGDPGRWLAGMRRLQARVRGGG